MSAISEDSVFTSLKQEGPLAVPKSVVIDKTFSPESRLWVKNICTSSTHITKYRALRSQIFALLNISHFKEIEALIKTPQCQQEKSQRAYSLLANMFDMQGSNREIEARVNEYARTADAVVNSLKEKILAPYTAYIATTNEIAVVNNPIELILIMFNDRYHRKARFEARRKLVLMSLAGSIDQRERETKIEDKFSKFLNFLNCYVWSKKQKIGEHDIAFLHSIHREDNFSCSSVKVISPKELKNYSTGKGIKQTLLKRRRFTVRDKDIPIHVSVRKKPPEAKVLKLLRKNQKNPAVAVDDELGLMAVLDSMADIKTFQNHLTQSAAEANSFLALENISDSLSENSLYRSHAIGSSNKTPMMKFFARLGGMRVEFIIHTNKSWLNYMYQKDVAHDEYEVKRFFDSGVAELLFPRKIFHLDHGKIRNEMIQLFRQHIEGE
ncbi:hypothetical protein [Desulfotalea psychrophila]|nr:hypothetical protein [Desulfotalea psychrophila]